jgi:pantetheine-phosphate adenylyltransferase
MKVCIGGTFNQLHKGHKLLIDKAFEVAGKQGSVFIGISAGEIIKEKKDVKSFEERKKIIEKYLYEKDFIKRAIVKPIIDKYGPSIKEEFDAIVVSPETHKTAEEINEKRKQNGRTPLKIIQIPFVLAEDGCPISSSRMREHEIDEDGRLLS